MVPEKKGFYYIVFSLASIIPVFGNKQAPLWLERSGYPSWTCLLLTEGVWGAGMNLNLVGPRLVIENQNKKEKPGPFSEEITSIKMYPCF